MTCTELERLLDQGEPDGQTKLEMQRHADTCEHCRLLLELRSLDRDEEVPEEVSTRWKAAIRTEKAKAGMKRRTGFLNSRVLAPVFAAAAILVAVAALRQPIASLGGKQTVVLSSPVSSEESVPAATAAPRQEAAGTAMPTSGPKLRAMATAMPSDLSMNSVPKEAATEQAGADENGAPMLAAGAAKNAAPMSAMLYQTNEECEETVADVMYDCAMPEDDAGTQPAELAWVSDAPADAAAALLREAGLTEAEMDTDDYGVTLCLSVSREDVPAFFHALETAGCSDLPEEGDLSWDEAGICRFILTIEKGETNQ